MQSGPGAACTASVWVWPVVHRGPLRLPLCLATTAHCLSPSLCLPLPWLAIIPSPQAYPQWRRQPEPVEEAEPSQRPAQPERYQRPVQPEQARPVQAHVHEARQHPEAKDEHRVQLMSTEPDSPPVITRQQAPRERPAAAPRTTSPEKQPAVQDSQPQRVVVKGSTNAAPNKKQQASVFSKATRYAVNKVRGAGTGSVCWCLPLCLRHDSPLHQCPACISLSTLPCCLTCRCSSRTAGRRTQSSQSVRGLS
jgi:hypothetical protein